MSKFHCTYAKVHGRYRHITEWKTTVNGTHYSLLVRRYMTMEGRIAVLSVEVDRNGLWETTHTARLAAFNVNQHSS